ncbi:retrovirus-related pol polyprotein from transposon TNT 1-94 [Tanacetum coccineum]
MLAKDDMHNWRSRFLRYIDKDQKVPEQHQASQLMNMTSRYRLILNKKKEAIQLLLTRIGNEIIKLLMHVRTSQELWEASKGYNKVNNQDSRCQGQNLFWSLVNFILHRWSLSNHLAPTSKASLQPDLMQLHDTMANEIDKPITPPSESASEKTVILNQAQKNVDTTSRYKNDNQTGQFRNQRAVNVVGARETIGGLVVTTVWGHNEVPNADSGTDTKPSEQVQYDTDDNVFTNDIQHFDQSESIRMIQNDVDVMMSVLHCNLIANLKLDVDENKKIQKQLKKANATLTQELTECKSILAETSRTLGESNSIRDSCLVALQNKQTEFERYKAFNDRTVDYDKLELVKEKREDVSSNSVFYQVTLRCLVKEKTKPVTLQNLPKTATQVVRNTNVIKPDMYRIASSTTQTRAPQLNQTSRNTNPRVSTSTGVITKANVSQTTTLGAINGRKIAQLFLFIVDSGCTKHMTGNLSLLFGSKKYHDQKGLLRRRSQSKSFPRLGNSVMRDWEVAFEKSTCFVRDSSGKDVLTVSKAKRSSFKLKTVPSSKGRLNLLHIDLCGPMQVASINGKKYILVIVNDYSIYTWTLFLRSKDETPEVLKDFLTMIQRNLQTLVISVRTDRGTEFLNKTLNAFFKEEGIAHQTSTPRTPEQNSVVERQNRTLIEAARTMLSASKLPLFFWTEAIATACYTKNRLIIIPTHEKTAYRIINDKKSLIKHLHIFGCTCYLTRDGENLDKMKEKGDPCILVGYSTQSKGYRVYNKRIRLIVESIHLRFDEIKEMLETSVANDTSGLVPQRQKASNYDNPDPAPELQNVSPLADITVQSQQELDLLFGPLYDEFFNDGTSRVNKSFSPTDNST